MRGKQVHFRKNSNKKLYLSGIWDVYTKIRAVWVNFSGFQKLSDSIILNRRASNVVLVSIGG